MVATGEVVSSFQVVEPVADNPLFAAVTRYVIVPDPCGRGRAQVVPTGQVKGVPPTVPEMVRAKP